MKRWLCLLLFGSVFTVAYAHRPADPAFLAPEAFRPWQTLETAHFRIYYPAAVAATAPRVAAVAETLHARLERWLGWKPRQKTEVVLFDNLDLSNGSATPVPYNRITLYLPAPTEGALVDASPWLETVFLHEYVHILHLDMVSGAPRVFRRIFGRLDNLFAFLTFPQLFAPSWVGEGLAVYGESDNPDGFGRLNNATYGALMRMEVAGGLRSLTGISYEGYSASRWPPGLNYLYGAWFYRFVAERYGERKLRDYIRIYARNGVPWRMDSRAWQIFGKSGKQLWAEYQAYLRQRFGPELARLQQRPQAPRRHLYREPYRNRLLTRGDAGSIYFYHDDLLTFPAIMRVDREGRVERIMKLRDVLDLDWRDDRGLLISRLSVCRNVQLVADLYRWRPGDWGITRLTRCGRYPRARWQPDGPGMTAVQLQGEASRLVQLDTEGRERAELWRSRPGEVMGQFDWSPDGRVLVAAIRRADGWNLERWSTEAGWQRLTRDRAREVRPRIAADGRHVWFLSDHDGVWNVRRMALAGGPITTHSNSHSQIIEAVPLDGNRLVVSEYTREGEELLALDASRVLGRIAPSSPARGEPPSPARRLAPTENVAARSGPYSPWRNLYPRSWFPVLDLNADETAMAGVVLRGQDVLGFHRWQAVPLWYLEQNTAGGLFGYTYRHRYGVSGDRILYTEGEPEAAQRWLRTETRWQAQAVFPVNHISRSGDLTLAVAHESLDWRILNGTRARSSQRNTLAGIIGRYDDTERYVRAISLADGRRISFTLESYDWLGQSDYRGLARIAEWREYIALGRGHVLRLQGRYALGDDGIRPFELGGETPPVSSLGGSSRLGQRRFPLRGYPAGRPSLTGTRAAMGSIEWRLPLGLVYDGFFVPPIGLGRHSLSLFVDSGDAWSAGESPRWHTGAGLEWRGELLLGYDLLPIGLRVGYARGFDEPGEDRFYLTLGWPL